MASKKKLSIPQETWSNASAPYLLGLIQQYSKVKSLFFKLQKKELVPYIFIKSAIFSKFATFLETERQR